MKVLLFIILGGITFTSIGSDRYFLCGSDEDGCRPGQYGYCFCIPYNDLEANEPHCLDFDLFKCTPLRTTPNCKPSFIFKNQAQCLATIFQSEPVPPCTVTTHDFCMREHVTMCDANGQLDSCMTASLG